MCGCFFFFFLESNVNFIEYNLVYLALLVSSPGTWRFQPLRLGAFSECTGLLQLT